jgi:BirA family transcriptional regulator, biotin operon repressor / biotin---[acetyl-CoA-carboxylase] ligase
MNRSAILGVLRSRVGQFVSGEELGRQLSISRTAVSKQIQKMRQEGYDIESTVSQGHRLKRLPDLLRPEEVCPRLTTSILGTEIYYYSEIGSTNDEAKKRAVAGCPEGTLVITEAQLGGRGRLSRGWFSPAAKGIWFSLVLRPPFPPQEAPKCTLMAAVALNRAIRDIAGIPCGIKWPNDILCNGRKLVGILTEMSSEMDAINHIVIGMGINVNIDAGEIPPELEGIATSISMETGVPVSRIDLFVRVLERMEELYVLVRTTGFGGVLAAWRQESVTLGRWVNVIAPDKSYAGKALDIDSDGALLVETAEGVERVLAGDVSIRPLDPGQGP